MNDEQQKALRQALAAHLKSGVEILSAWHAGLSTADATKLAELEGRGLRLGLSVAVPQDRCVVQVFLLDSAGKSVVIDTIEQTGALPSVTIN